MSDIDETMGSPIIEKIGGKDVEFPLLLNEDYGTIENKVRQSRLVFWTDLIGKCQLNGADKFVAMRDNYTPWIDPTQVAAYLRTHDGANLAVKISLKKNGMTDEQAQKIIAQFKHNDLSALAWELIGFAKRDRPLSPDEKGEPPSDPTATPAASQPTGELSTLA